MARLTAATAKKALSAVRAHKRKAAVKTACDYLDAQMKSASHAEQLSMMTVKAALQNGATLGAAMQAGLPWLNAQGVKQASAAFVKSAMLLNPSSTGMNVPKAKPAMSGSKTGLPGSMMLA